MAWITLDPITRKRFERFRRIKHWAGLPELAIAAAGAFGLLLLVNASYVMQLFHDPRGVMMVGAGFASLFIGCAVMMKMVRFEI